LGKEAGEIRYESGCANAGRLHNFSGGSTKKKREREKTVKPAKRGSGGGGGGLDAIKDKKMIVFPIYAASQGRGRGKKI